MPTLTLAAKDLRLLLRDPRSAVILLVTPLLLIVVLYFALGEGFGEKPDERLRISIVNADAGVSGKPTFPGKPWSEIVIDDLSATQDIRLEIIPDRAEAERLVAKGRRPAVIVFGEGFSEKMQRCSFLSQPDSVNPLGRDGIEFDRLDLKLITDKAQPVSASVIEQVTQVTLLRVVIPWMIGKAFQRVGDEKFMEAVAQRLGGVKPIPPEVLGELDPIVQKLLTALMNDADFQALILQEFRATKGSTFVKASSDALVVAARREEFKSAVHKAFGNEKLLKAMGKEVSFGEVLTPAVRRTIGPTVKRGVGDLFSNYNFEATSWSDLVKSDARLASTTNRATLTTAADLRGPILVPANTVMFAFFLVLTVGWLFVAERKNGTLVRLRAAPLTRGQILLGKLIPCLVVSLFQSFFLLAAGRLLLSMSWGPRPELLIPLVACTSFAAVGLSILVASVARTETQVAVYGTLLVLVLGGISGSLLPRELMPERMKAVSLVTPHAWALDAYAQLLTAPDPDVSAVYLSCGVLLAFGAAFTALAWWRLDLEQ
jgi:ABC-type multidrug transport system permease subunit